MNQRALYIHCVAILISVIQFAQPAGLWSPYIPILCLAMMGVIIYHQRRNMLESEMWASCNYALGLGWRRSWAK